MSRNPVLGVWRLVSCEAVRANGARLPIYGKRPVGRLHYDSEGNMSVQIMRSGRRRSASRTKFRATEDEKQGAFEGYEAYFSTYTINAKDGTIHHRVLGSLFPNWTGSVQTRYFALDNQGRLVLSTTPIGAQVDGTPTVLLVWERVHGPKHDSVE